MYPAKCDVPRSIPCVASGLPPAASSLLPCFPRSIHHVFYLRCCHRLRFCVMKRQQWVPKPGVHQVWLCRYYTIVCRARSSAEAGQGGYRETAALPCQARFLARTQGLANQINHGQHAAQLTRIGRACGSAAFRNAHSHHSCRASCLRNIINARKGLGPGAKPKSERSRKRTRPVSSSFAHRERTAVHIF